MAARLLSQTAAHSNLLALAQIPFSISSELSEDRIKRYHIENELLTFNFSASYVWDDVLDQLESLAIEQNVIAKYDELLAGNVMNPSEARAVLHHHTRKLDSSSVYADELNRVQEFVRCIHSAELRSPSDRPFRSVVLIGIGGSSLGPKAMFHALKRLIYSELDSLPMSLYFVENVDPDNAKDVLSKINVHETLFVVISKSGTTQETTLNLGCIQQALKAAGIPEDQIQYHFVCVTARGSQMDGALSFFEVFHINDTIGGRFSVSSVVGGLVLSLALGSDTFTEFLSGAQAMDEHAQSDNVWQNIPLSMALLNVWESTYLGYRSRAIVPYSDALSYFPMYLQQLICESNGKSVSIDGEKLDYLTSPVIFGDVGSNAQHSFFQLLHQGSDVIPVEFIIFREGQYANLPEQLLDALWANTLAQKVALATGEPSADLNDYFYGNRSSRILVSNQLTPEVLGALVSLYENMVMFEGFLWHINSFDQPGVQLGKKLTQRVLTGQSDGPLKAYINLLA